MVKTRGRLFLPLLGLLLMVPGDLRAQNQAPAPAAASSADLQKVITQLNAASAKFVSAQADFSWDQYQAAVQESVVQTGSISFERKKGADSTRTAALFKTEDGKPAPKTMTYDHGEVNLYEPTIKQITVFHAGANRSQWESFMTLGFGGSGTDLQTNWKVTLEATETLDGVSVARLNLVPVQAKVLELFTHVTIWVDPVRGVSLKQIFYQPGGDKRTAIYSNIRYNQPIPNDVFKISAAPGTHRVDK